MLSRFDVHIQTAGRVLEVGYHILRV